MDVAVKFSTRHKIYWLEVDSYCDDNEIAGVLNLSLKEYSKLLIQKYNAFLSIDEDDEKHLCFEETEDAFKAFEWVQSALMAKKLANGNDDTYVLPCYDDDEDDDEDDGEDGW